MNRFSTRIAFAVLVILAATDVTLAQGPGYYVGPLGHVRYRHHGHHQAWVRNPGFWRNAAFIAADLGHVFVFGGTPGVIGGGGGNAPSGGGDVVTNPRQQSATIELATSSEEFQSHEDEMLRRAQETAAALADIRASLNLPPRTPPADASGGTPANKPPVAQPPVPVNGGGVIVQPRPPG